MALLVIYVWRCDFCEAIKEQRVEASRLGPIPYPGIPDDWSTAWGDRVACPKHKVVVVDR